MGWFDAIDKLANAGAGSRMPAETRDKAKNQAVNTNRRNQLADRAHGGSASRADQRKARRDLVNAVGERETERLIKESEQRHKRGFFS